MKSNLKYSRVGLSVLAAALVQSSALVLAADASASSPGLALNELEYLEMQGLNVMLAHDYYPEGHQGGVGIIQNGLRVATDGDLRLDRTPGQWQPVPKVGKRVVDKAKQEISLRNEYPDAAKDRKGFNPVIYPDLHFAYVVRIRPEGKAFRIVVDLEQPLPAEWDGKVSFNIELFPGILFGKSYSLDGQFGIFPRQANGPGAMDANKEYHIAAMAHGKKLVIAPESERQRMSIEAIAGGELELVDGRGQHDNGWFVVRGTTVKGATKNAVEWLISPNAIPGWKSEPVVQVSQVGYHPKQEKIAVIELDARETQRLPVVLSRVSENGGLEPVLSKTPQDWGRFLRYNYIHLDFTDVVAPGMYIVSYGDSKSNPFKIGADVYQRDVWQPTLEYFLPVQMCHMRVNDRYRVWHGACHLDDARMAPTNYNHFDGYIQGGSTLCKYQSGEPVPGLNLGGWHDAGDDDLRIESQAETMYGLALAREAFGVDYDDTTVDQKNRLVELHRPDGKADILQQLEHGALSVVGGYKTLGRFYRGIICTTLRQYTLLGDTANQTDNQVFDPKKAVGEPSPVGLPGSPDDRWVFTEENPSRQMQAAAWLAATGRALKGFNDELAADCQRITEEYWKNGGEKTMGQRIHLAVELLISTKDRQYAEFLIKQRETICKSIDRYGWIIGRALPLIGDAEFTKSVTEAVRGYAARVQDQGKKTPYGVPYSPDIWGAGWGIQSFGMKQYFLHTGFPDVFPRKYMLQALNFILGCHPGPNNASFVSGVGSKSVTVGYGFNRADWTYIPGGSVSGTALIRPDYPELLEWPFLWQQTEYVLGGGTTDYLFLVLAADKVLNQAE